MDFKTLTIDDIINWCEANNQIEWLKATAVKKVPCKVYPRTTNEEGKKVADKTQEPKVEYRKITFIQIKTEFVNKFMPEIAPKKNGKKSMYDRIAAL